MKKGKVKSAYSLRPSKSTQMKEETIYVPPLDTLIVKVVALQVTDVDSRYYAIKVTLLDQLMLSGIIKPINIREEISKQLIATGTMNYDPSDYEKMCTFADNPLIVNIQALNNYETGVSDGQVNTPIRLSPDPSVTPEYCVTNPYPRTSCCNIDVLPLFTGQDEMCVKKRMEPMTTPSVLYCKSWDNLPLLTMKLSVMRDKRNAHHHEFLHDANHMKISLVGAYNMLIPYDEANAYIATTKLPILNEANSGVIMFYQGCMPSHRFNCTNFYPKWEALKLGDDVFTKGDEKVEYSLKELVNEANINVEYYLEESFRLGSIVWGSFHRTLLLGDSEKSLTTHIRNWSWPLEVHVFKDQPGSYSFLAPLNLFRLLYPGEYRIRLAVPLVWLTPEAMKQHCDCDLLLTPDRYPTPVSIQKTSKATTESARSTSTATAMQQPTGIDYTSAFVIVEVKLARPLVRLVLPKPLSDKEIHSMLEEMEAQVMKKRQCYGRGQLSRDWVSTVRMAANSLRRVPHYGMTEFCLFNRQLSETRTRVELCTSCWQDAAIYVNNNFVVQDFLQSDEMFEEMLMMAHACLMKITNDTLVGVENWRYLDPTLKAARHAYQMQDLPHATELYLLATSKKPYDENCWRELSTCLKETNRDWANICLDRALMLNMRHPLTLLAKGCMVYEECPDDAEPFFTALLAMFPFWPNAWVIANAYFTSREMHRMAEQVARCLAMTQRQKLTKDLDHARSWEHELGSWWDSTLLLPSMSVYYDAADLLLRLRAIKLAEVCAARAFVDTGESASYYHLVALCRRLLGNIDDALCHLKTAIEKYGEISYLRSLEAECYHQKKNINASIASYEKCGNCNTGFSILLSLPSWEPPRVRSLIVDLLRRQPSAYAWMALCDDWMLRVAVGEGGDAGLTEEQQSALVCANACAVQALRCDRRAGRAWAHLATSVQPSARRQYCWKMATICGYTLSDDRIESSSLSRQSLCHRLGVPVRDCHCEMCERLTV